MRSRGAAARLVGAADIQPATQDLRECHGGTSNRAVLYPR
jgi:hypothetical protein